MSDQKIRLSDFDPVPADEVDAALFENDLELDDDEVAEILATYCIDAEQTLMQFKTRLQGRIRDLSEDGTEPETLDDLRYFVRDISNYQKARSPENVKPKSWVSSILDNTNAAKFPGQTAYAYRGRDDEEIAEEDQKLIKELEDELDQDGAN